MSFLLECPNCGPRDVNEFALRGRGHARPRRRAVAARADRLLYFRDNVAGVQREWWYHRFGCELWFVAERDTRTNEVLGASSCRRSRRREPDDAA